MKILVVDDEHGLGSMMCRALRALGHEAVLAVHPEDALSLMDASIDAVVSDIDMPGMNGVELVEAIRARQESVPVAFCTGSEPEKSTLASAEALGTVLFKPWTVDDIHMLVEQFRCRPARPAAESGHDCPTAEMDSPSCAGQKAKRRVIRLTIYSWEQVLRLCARQSQGPVFLPLRVPGLREGDQVTVRFALPDGFSVSLAGEVRAVAAGPLEPGFGQTVELLGLDSNLTTRLSALADAGTGRANEVDTAEEQSGAEPWDQTLARGSQRMRVSELLMSNQRLKAQIEGLARKMRPRGGAGGKS